MSKLVHPTFASLFSGCGGFDDGFLQAGYKCEAAFDIDDDAIASYNLNFERKVQKFDLRHWEQAPIRPADVLLAGPPCQGFSTIGHRRADDPRNDLLIVPALLAAKFRPRVCVVENVMGVKAGLHSAYWRELRHIFRNAGYRLLEFECLATSFGLPQLRRRHVLVAWRTSGLYRPSLDCAPSRSLADAWEGVESAPDHEPVRLSPGSRDWYISQRIQQGQKLCNVRASPRAVHTWQVPEAFGDTTAEEKRILEALIVLRRRDRRRDFGDADPIAIHALSAFLGREVGTTVEGLVARGFLRRIGDLVDLTHTFNGKYRRLAHGQPSPTVDTRFGDPTCFLHPLEPRGLSVREAARVQGFGDGFRFSGGRRAKFRSIGNAVPPPMAKAVALLVRDILSNR